uniref:ARAD1D39600p n=1 Tax=Blastobotrys adeninivorans TaxID=409370 RepID=A0A060TCZ9_BLAAD
MKRELKWMLAINSAILLFLVYEVSDLLSLLLDSGASDAFTKEELNSNSSQALIPKIIHQTYKNESIPDIWKGPQQSCLDLHPDYTYMMWTDESAREFVATHYSWFLDTYDSYPYPIMRADVIRYFILSHYGGIYIDLDNGCTRRLDPLLQSPAWVRKTIPTGVSNDLMGSVPHHPFFKKVIANLERYNRNWFVSYITIMFSTGPLFVSVIWKQYKRTREAYQNPKALLRVLIPPTKKSTAQEKAEYFFYTAKGSSWHLGDAKFIFSMGKHWIFFTILGTALVLSVLYLQYRIYQKLSRWGGFRRTPRGKGRYIAVEQQV